jgi:hypothetical protein
MKTMREKVLLALGSGLLVALTAFVVNMSNVAFDRGLFLRLGVGDVMAGLVAGLLALAIQLRSDGVYYRFAMERAGIVAEMNHHVRNAVFPLCLIVHGKGDPESSRLATDAVERINVALRDAMTDAFLKNVDYGVAPVPVRSRDMAA